MYLPVLVEFTFTSSVIFLILVFVAITAVSWWTGASLLDFVLRTGIAMGVLGSLLMAVSRQVSAGVLSASQAEIEAELQKSLQDELDHAKSPPAIENAEQPEESGSDVMVENSEMEEIPATVEAQ